MENQHPTEMQPPDSLGSNVPVSNAERVIKPTEAILHQVGTDNAETTLATVTPLTNVTEPTPSNYPTINVQDYKESEAYIQEGRDRFVARRAPILYAYSVLNIVLSASTFLNFSTTKQKLSSQPGSNPTTVNEGQTLAIIILLIVMAITAYLIFTKNVRIVKRILMFFALLEAFGLLTSLGSGKLLSIGSSTAQFTFTVVTYIYVSRLQQNN